MSPCPDAFLRHIREQGYNPRSNKHSNQLAECIVSDLMQHCQSMAAKARAGHLVYDLNFTLLVGTAEWNVDLVLGRPALGGALPKEDGRIVRTLPSTVEVAIELKSVMTEHRKAVKNRKRDMEAHHDHVHRYSNDAIAGGLFVINGAARFQSPLRGEVTIHKNPARLVEHCVEEMRAVSSRSSAMQSGLDAKCVIVVDVDNIDLGSAGYVSGQPAPPVGDPLHYDAFIQRICSLHTSRFA